jgi:hypothetical protein
MSDYPSGPPNYGEYGDQSGWQQQQGYGGGPQWGQQPPGQSGKATAALVLGICGLLICPLICSVLALVFGYQSRNEIDASGGMIGGRGMAKAGIILGWVGIGITVLFVLLVIIGAVAGGGSSS